MIKNPPKKCCDPGIFSDCSGNAYKRLFGGKYCTPGLSNVLDRGQVDFINFMARAHSEKKYSWKDRVRKRSIPGSDGQKYASGASEWAAGEWVLCTGYCTVYYVR